MMVGTSTRLNPIRKSLSCEKLRCGGSSNVQRSQEESIVEICGANSEVADGDVLQYTIHLILVLGKFEDQDDALEVTGIMNTESGSETRKALNGRKESLGIFRGDPETECSMDRC